MAMDTKLAPFQQLKSEGIDDRSQRWRDEVETTVVSIGCGNVAEMWKEGSIGGGGKGV